MEFKITEKLFLPKVYTVYRVTNTAIEVYINNIMNQNGLTESMGYRGCRVRPNVVQSQINQNELVIAILFKISPNNIADPTKKYVHKTLADGFALRTNLQIYHITSEFKNAIDGIFIRQGTLETDVYTKEVIVDHVAIYLDYATVFKTIVGANIEDIGIMKIVPKTANKEKEVWDIQLGVLASSRINETRQEEKIDASNILTI